MSQRPVRLAFVLALVSAAAACTSASSDVARSNGRAEPAPSSPPSATAPPSSQPSPPPDAAAPDDAGAPDADAAPATCGPPLATKGFVGRRSVTVKGATRTYDLFVPQAYDGVARFPVVLAFHGDEGSGAVARASFDIEGASAGAAIVAYPDGANQTWDVETAPAQNPDYAFVDALVADLVATSCADPARVYAWGVSKGGFFVNQLGCYRANLVRAIAAQSGGGPLAPGGGDPACAAPAPAALVMHGDADTVVPYATGEYSREHWRAANGCGGATTPFAPSPCVTYDGCAAGRPVGWCGVPGAAHGVWPGSAQATWSFFASLAAP